MPESPKKVGGGRTDPRPSAVMLARAAGGGFRLEGPDGWLREASPTTDGWAIRGGAGQHRLKRQAAGGGFVLAVESSGGTLEAGRTSHAAGGGRGGTISLLLADGRLFCVATSPGPEWGFDLVGWEVPGAYWTARSHDRGWRLAATAAGEALEGFEEIVILLAAEILDAEDTVA